MNFPIPLYTLSLICCAGITLILPAQAEQAAASSNLHYKWTAGQTLRYLVQQDPYFADPAGAIETADSSAPYRPPSVNRLTEEVLAVGKDGTATLRLTLMPEPGFEEETAQEPVVQTVMVTSRGHLLPQAYNLPAATLLSAIFSLPEAAASAHGPLTILTQDGLPCIAKNTTSSHDGLLLQTTQSRRGERVLFDTEAGILRRRVVTITGSLSLVMIRPGQRGAADFGRVVPILPISQTLTIEQMPYVGPPLLASAARQSKS